MPHTLVGCPYFRRAFGWSVPIGGLAGLIGLGGGEFRLPVLMHSVGFDAKSAVPAAMSAGSILGAIIGGFAVAYAPVDALKILLGILLIGAAAKTLASHA